MTEALFFRTRNSSYSTINKSERKLRDSCASDNKKGEKNMDIRMNNQELAKEYREKLVGKKFKHFKGNIYKVIEVGIHSEDAGCMVIYHTDGDESLVWVRPLEMFLSEVDKNKYPNVKQKYRFEELTD